MFNQTPFNATAFNADDGGGGSVDATVTLTGFDVAIEFGNLVALVTRDITQVGADPRVQQLHAILTELINEWRLEDVNKQEYNSKLEG